jgi:hypothetical protein
MSAQTSRVVWLTFSSPVGSSPLSPLPDGYYNARVVSRCFDANNNIVDLLKIPAGTTNNRCSLRVGQIFSGGTQYLFLMTPDTPGTGFANVTCKAADGTGCTSWTIVPNLDAGFAGNVPTVAHLYSIAPRNGKQTLIGSYHNTYRIDLKE